MNSIKETIGTYTISVTVGSAHNAPLEAMESYANALSLHQTVSGKCRMSFYDEICSSIGHVPQQVFNGFIEEMKSAIRKGEKDKLVSAFIHLRSSLNEQLSFSSLMHQRLTSLLIGMLEELGALPDESIVDLSRISAILLMPDKLNKTNLDIINSFCSSICSYSHDRFSKYTKVVNEVQNYISNNYMHDIGLNDIAQSIGFTPVYINRILKTQIGTTFYELLTKYRIEQAQKLLAQSKLTINDISSRVGYVNTQSFLRMYKKTTNQTPTQFRERAREDSARGSLVK